MKEYNPICFLIYLVEQNKNNSFQINVRRFNEELHKIENSLWNQHYHIDFGFNTFCRICSTRFPEWIYFDNEKINLSIKVDDEFIKVLNNYIKIFDIPNYEI